MIPSDGNADHDSSPPAVEAEAPSPVDAAGGPAGVESTALSQAVAAAAQVKIIEEAAPRSTTRATLPPPEWTSRNGGRVCATEAPPPLARRTGARAEEAWMRARVEEGRASGDAALARAASAALARWLASRDRDIDEAADLAARALEMGEDIELRRELAAWLESLGEPARAAATLRAIAAMPEVDSAEAAYVLVRTGVLKARAGAAAGAAAAFEAALPIDPDDPLPAELLGAVAEWAEGAVVAALAAESYVEAARRRARQGDDEAALEDAWRAFAADATSGRAVQSLVDALERRGRDDAADEVWRAHARAVAATDPERAAVVHSRRRPPAVAANRAARALGAALDEGLDRRFEGEGADAFDARLLDVGLLEVLAARLAVRYAEGDAAVRAAGLVELARLYAGPMDDEVRATMAYRAALGADPTCQEAAGALRVRGDATPLAELAPPADDGSDSQAAAAAGWVATVVASGDARSRAAALERVARTVDLGLRGVLLSTAAADWLLAGDATAARRAAEGAVQADPQSARAVATLADVLVREGRDRTAAAALERAIARVGPFAEWCGALADALDALGELALAVSWSQRTLALRPGDHACIDRLVERLARSGDSGRLADTLGWLLSQPQPSSWWTGPFANALRDLARLDVDRAAVLARRALDIFGPQSLEIRAAMLDVAAAASDDGFAAAVLERWFASGAQGPERRDLLLWLAELRERLGDHEGQARILARAVQEGVSASALDTHFERLANCPLAPDGQLWLLNARAARLSEGGASDVAAQAWRELGAALWDFADDKMGAIAAWQRAARLAPARGHATFALDLVAFAGEEFAFEFFVQLVETEPDDANAGAIAADVARAALSAGAAQHAFDLAARGVARCPACTAALEAAELAADRTGDRPALSALYELVAARALGRFGRRAAHYRGARYFERCSEHALALKHAAQAFYSVPSEGSSLQLLARAAVRAGDRTQAVRTLEQVADDASQAQARASWLLRAASLAGDGEEGARRKIDVLLRAAVAAPGAATIDLVRDTARDLLRFAPEEREVLEIRLGRAARAITERLGGPEGARVALAFAAMSLELFGDAEAAFTCLERALAADADIDEYTAMIPRAPALALENEVLARVARLLDHAERPQAGVGVAALRLLAAVASAAGDEALRARAIIAAATRGLDDDALVVEADLVARASPLLADSLAARVTSARRVEALLATARARMEDGRPVEAGPLFERAVELCDPQDRGDVERELRAAWEAAGRGGEIEARVQQEAASAAASPAMRADRWTEIAERREARGDKSGSVRALLEACKLDPQPMRRWSALERVAEIAGDDDARVAALDQIARRVGDDGRVAVLKRLARAHERRADIDAAVSAWDRVLTLDGDDDEADHAIESLIVARGRYAELVDHLARRAERLSTRSGAREMLRAVRLRRAAILEQRLGRVQDACDELALLLSEWPDNAGALRYLADLLERQGQFVRAAPLWRRAAAVEPDAGARDELELRAGRASRAAGDLDAAMGHANQVLASNPTNPGALELRLEVARDLGADRDLGEALEAVASSDTLDEKARSDLLLEAAQAAARAGDVPLALDRARQAAAVAGERATPQLLARGLEYRLRGAGAPDEARRTIEELSGIREPLGPDDEALRAFLLAEALDVVQGGGAGTRELEATRTTVGDHPLVALGLAERLLAQGQHARAVDAYRIAVGHTLLDLRRPGAVAITAADAALRCSRRDDAAAFLAVAERHQDSREAAEVRRATLAQLEAVRGSTPAQEPVPQLPPHSGWPTPEPAGPAKSLEELEEAARLATTPGERARARLALGRARFETGDAAAAEPILWEALADGLVAAGDLLARVLADSPERARDLVRVRRQQVYLEPGDIERLEALRAAALADDDRIYVRAVEHVLRAFDPGAGPLPPPPLASQPEQPGLFALLARPSMDASGEALALLWEGAMQLFLRDAASYGITGVERVVPGPTSAIARTYEAAMRILDAPRIPLFVPRAAAAGHPVAHVALLSPPSVILVGDVRQETTDLRLALGRGMSAALGHNVLRLGLPPADGRAVIDAMRAAFAPPEVGRTLEPRAARLAESFWQIVPARTQRRLQELLASATVAPYEDLLARAHQSGRRVGMFLAGDFGSAARAVLVESGFGAGEPMTLETLRPLCERVPELADLLCLAVSPEYASGRWHVVAPGTPHGTMFPASGRFSLF
jgi:tetratricopeptide (TPR) repeat protein